MTDPPIRIFTLVDHYLPGFRHGGPTRTVSNLVSKMPPRYQFLLFTRDRDQGVHEPYPDVPRNQWVQVGRARVYYASPGALSWWNLARLVREVDPHVVYTNSLFSRLTIRFLLLRKLGLVRRLPFIIAPRGEMASSALGLKRLKKKLFLRLAIRAGWFRDTLWQASTEFERADIERALPADAEVRVSRNIAVAIDALPEASAMAMEGRPAKVAGQARFVYLARIARVKNLEFGVRMLAKLGQPTSLDVYGPIDDLPYWDACQRAAARGPELTLRYLGPVEHSQVLSTMQQNDFLLLPTLGENFGHSIFEALVAGCPPVISDKTPWRDLESAGTGWDLPLDDEDAWQRALAACVVMGPAEHEAMAEAGRRFALAMSETDSAVEQSVALFQRALQASGRPED